MALRQRPPPPTTPSTTFRTNPPNLIQTAGMAPPRRKSTNSTSTAQKTLAFGPHSNKVTKPSLPPSSLKEKKLTKTSSENLLKAASEISATPLPAPEIEDPVEEAPSQKSRGLAIRESQSQDAPLKKSEVEERAAKVGDAQVKRYWRGKQEERKAPRVHQQALTLHEKILRHFDLSSQYGPCIGIPRQKRWKRAEGLGLHPPIEVLAVLQKEEGKGNGKVERAFMDELLTSRIGAE